jgi:hypothetical protein
MDVLRFHTLLTLRSVKNNAKLEDRIAAMLQPEKLSGDNQFVSSFEH